MMYSTREISPDAMRKLAGNKGKHTEGQHMETSGSTPECDWVVGSQILTGTTNPKVVSGAWDSAEGRRHLNKGDRTGDNQSG